MRVDWLIHAKSEQYEDSRMDSREKLRTSFLVEVGAHRFVHNPRLSIAAIRIGDKHACPDSMRDTGGLEGQLWLDNKLSEPGASDDSADSTCGAEETLVGPRQIVWHG
jgi:hypothetical protein